LYDNRVGDIVKKILRRLERKKRLNKKAFTLIEVLGVIVIIGIILIVAFPSLAQMIHDNDNEELSNYYVLVDEAAQVYAAKLTEQLGSSKYTGCAEVTLDELIDAGYVQKFNNNKVTCSTGSGNIKIRNNKGVISVNFQLSCSEDGKDVYITGKNDNESCEAYVMETQTTLKTTLEGDRTIRKVNASNEVYLTGANPKNYVWYSGKLWRIVSYNALTETTKAVTVNSMTSIYYNSSATNSSLYSGSDVETWINNEFYNSLKDPSKFIINGTWNATPNSSIVSNPKSPDKEEKAKVGMLSTFDYGKVQDWYGTTETWLLSEGNGGYSLYSSAGEIETTSSKTMLGVKPVVTFSSDVNVYGGSGTLTDPYIIDNTKNAIGKPGEYINTRFSGEYVKIGNSKYRIVSNDAGILKVIGTQKLGNYMYSDNHFDYASSNLRKVIEEQLSQEFLMAEHGDFCMDTINSGNATYQSSKCLTPSRVNNNIKIGVPKIGDMLTTNIPGLTEDYWTLNPNTELDGNGNHYGSTMNLVSATGRVTTDTISTQKAAVIVFYLNSNVKISSGTGTSRNPYVLTL